MTWRSVKKVLIFLTYIFHAWRIMEIPTFRNKFHRPILCVLSNRIINSLMPTTCKKRVELYKLNGVQWRRFVYRLYKIKYLLHLKTCPVSLNFGKRMLKINKLQIHDYSFSPYKIHNFTSLYLYHQKMMMLHNRVN